MPSSSDTKDVLYLSTKQNIINFSDNWRSLYHPFTWPKVIHGEETVQSENRNYFNNINMPECEQHHPYIPYGEYFIANNFIPNNHSTPNKITTKRESIASCTHSGTVDEMSFSTTYPDASLSADRCHNSSSEDRVEYNTSLDSVNALPSISRDIDAISRNKYTCQEVYCDRSPERRVRRKGIKGVRCIVGFALTDDPVKKQTQIRACSISIMILAIVSISSVLVYFISNKYNVTQVSVPSNSSNSSMDTLITRNSTASLPALHMQLLTHLTSTASPTFSTSFQLLNDAPMEERNTSVSKIIQKIQKNLKSYPKFPRSKTANETGISDPVKNVTEAKDTIKEYCSKCQKDVQVCMLNEESGIPVCIQAVDRHDPTGCGGLCALDTEACQLVDRVRGVRACRAISLRCSALQWRCYNELCVPKGSRCDGVVDCYDRSDEMHCECDLSKNFHCGHSTSCFPNSKLCDGHVDCWDGLDEVNCTNTCPNDEFTCNDGQCITSARFCDGLADCTDGSDEPSGCDGACAANEMQCANKRCISRSTWCDGVDNCGDRTDEHSCS